MSPPMTIRDQALLGAAGVSVQVCQTSQAWDDEGTGNMSALYAGNKRTIQGVIIISGSDFDEQNLKTATFYIKKTGSPEGTISCKLYPSAVEGSGLGTETEESSNTFSIQTDWADGEVKSFAFTFSGANDIAVGNALVIVGAFTTSGASDYINLISQNYSPDPEEQQRQYQRETGIAQWEGQDNMNARFKVCN